jgi:hypothetical protein
MESYRNGKTLVSGICWSKVLITYDRSLDIDFGVGRKRGEFNGISKAIPVTGYGGLCGYEMFRIPQ